MSGVGRADLRVLNAPYVTSKFAVVGLTETMAPALRDRGIGASVLCPGLTVVDPSGPVQFKMPSGRWYEHNLLGPDDVAEEVLRGVADGRVHIFPHEAGLSEVLGRHDLLIESFRRAGITG
jgi:short-subunit dehydrogenase